MKYAGPSFLTWLLGRLAHPITVDRCSSCGTEMDGLGRAAALPGPLLCPSCRRTRLLSSLRSK
jgi:hypothetical protein